MAELFRVVLPVSNIDVAESFYADLFGQQGSRISGGRHYFRCGSVILACYDPWADGDDPAGGWKLHPHQVLSLAVDDLEATLTHLRTLQGAHIDSEIEITSVGRAELLCPRSVRQPALLRRSHNHLHGRGARAGVAPCPASQKAAFFRQRSWLRFF